MRVDLVLKYLCLVKSRSAAKALCGAGRVLVDGDVVRPSTVVRPGARVTVRFDRGDLSVRLLDVPRKQLSRASAAAYYERVETPPEECSPGSPADPFFDPA